MEFGDLGSKRRVMERIGTSAAAVPAAMTSENLGSSISSRLSTEVTLDLRDAPGSHAPNDAIRVRDDQRQVVVPVHDRPNKAARAELVDLRVCSAIEVQGDAEALLGRAAAPPEHERVIAADLGVARAVGRRAVEVIEHEAVDGVHAVVHARGYHP
ncbi:hypothetical protein DL767_006695 [Monosporascus sp. MG133]|nr:hypothetical protein DL767_006695 [Monosporascus sp. MG133]